MRGVIVRIGEVAFVTVTNEADKLPPYVEKIQRLLASIKLKPGELV